MQGGKDIIPRILKRHEEALTAQERAIRLDPSYTPANTNRGSIRILSKDTVT